MLRSRLTHPTTQRVLAAAIAACFGSVAVAQPAGMTAIHGTASAQQDGARTTVTTTNGAGTRHSAIDWRSFSVPAERSVYFSQPDAVSTSINRVTGPDPSSIFGTLGSNGRLVLVNPAGIAVGTGAVVDTAGFTASTLPMSAADAIAGKLRFGTGDTSATEARLTVQGEVLARNGDVVLVGPKIETGQPAVVRAQGGDVILAAGRKVYLTGRGLEGIRFEVRAPDDRALNLGRLQGDSVGIFASLLQHSGTIRAEGSRDGGGKVVLQGGQQAEIAGTIQASAPGQGGSVQVSAERLVLKASTTIDVSHRNGGGEILLGGGWQGRDARITNALAVDVEQGVVLKADATLSGNGGTVVVWSDDTTRFRGTLTALGAGPGGAGGRAEVSGRRQLIFRGKVDLGAENGATGSLLLDPDNVTIRGGTGDGSDALPTPNSADDLLGAGGLLASMGASDYTIYESELEGMNASIAIQANKRIQASGSFGGNELLLAPNRNLKLEVLQGGGTGIALQGMPIRTQGSGTVELRSGSGGQDIRPDRITTAGGSITLAAARADIQLDAPLDAAGGAISLTGKKVEFNANQSFSAGTRVTIAAARIDNNAGLALASGATLATGGTDFDNNRGAVLAGSGLLDLAGGKLVNDGILRPGGAGAVGELRVAGAVELRNKSQLEIDVASASSYDRLLASGAVKLDGRLVLAARGYAPEAADGYALLEGASVSGTFASVAAAGFAGMAPAYDSARVRFARPAVNGGSGWHFGQFGNGDGDHQNGQEDGGDRTGNRNAGDGTDASLAGNSSGATITMPTRPSTGTTGGPTTGTTTGADTGTTTSTTSTTPSTGTTAGPTTGTSTGTTTTATTGATVAGPDSVSSGSGGTPVAAAPAPRQAVATETQAATETAMQQLAWLPAQDSAPEQERQKRKVVVTAVQCRAQ
jgi:filamentous hemagglutinin family protein